MSFIKVGLGEDIKERSSVPEGDYTLIISEISEKPASSGSAMLTIIHAIDGEPDAQPVKQWITLPTEGDDQEAIRNKSLGLKRYLTLAGIPFEEDGFDTEALYGHTFSARLLVELVDTDRDGNPIDKPYEINRISVPFLEDEG